LECKKMGELGDLIDEFKKAPPAGKALAIVSVMTVAGLGLYVAHTHRANSASSGMSSSAGVLPVDVSSALGGNPSSGVPYPNFPAGDGTPTPSPTPTPTPTPSPTPGPVGEQGTFGLYGANADIRIAKDKLSAMVFQGGKWVPITVPKGGQVIQGTDNRVWLVANGKQSLLTSGKAAPVVITNNDAKHFQSHVIAGAYSVSPPPLTH
jgi:hypothetical protein